MIAIAVAVESCSCWCCSHFCIYRFVFVEVEVYKYHTERHMRAAVFPFCNSKASFDLACKTQQNTPPTHKNTNKCTHTAKWQSNWNIRETYYDNEKKNLVRKSAHTKSKYRWEKLSSCTHVYSSWNFSKNATMQTVFSSKYVGIACLLKNEYIEPKNEE